MGWINYFLNYLCKRLGSGDIYVHWTMFETALVWKNHKRRWWIIYCVHFTLLCLINFMWPLGISWTCKSILMEKSEHTLQDKVLIFAFPGFVMLNWVTDLPIKATCHGTVDLSFVYKNLYSSITSKLEVSLHKMLTWCLI